MGFEIQKKFDYAEVSADLGASLRKHEVTIRGIQSKAIYDIGEELAAARDVGKEDADGKENKRFKLLTLISRLLLALAAVGDRSDSSSD